MAKPYCKKTRELLYTSTQSGDYCLPMIAIDQYIAKGILLTKKKARDQFPSFNSPGIKCCPPCFAREILSTSALPGYYFRPVNNYGANVDQYIALDQTLQVYLDRLLNYQGTTVDQYIVRRQLSTSRLSDD